jgi:hypothetical protein
VGVAVVPEEGGTLVVAPPEGVGTVVVPLGDGAPVKVVNIEGPVPPIPSGYLLK